MSRISPELDAHMWSLAENASQPELDAFVAQNPALAVELEQRRHLVASLKGSKVPSSIVTIPDFQLRPAPSLRSMHFAAGAVGLAVLAYASFLGTQALVGHQPVEKPMAVEPVRQAQRAAPAVISQAEVERDAVPYSPNNELPPVYSDPPPPPVQIRMQETPLLTALQAIAAQSELKLEIPAGFPNPTVDVNLIAESGISALQELGREHGFSAFDQGGGVVLLIPAVEEEQPIAEQRPDA